MFCIALRLCVACADDALWLGSSPTKWILIYFYLIYCAWCVCGWEFQHNSVCAKACLCMAFFRRLLQFNRWSRREFHIAESFIFVRIPFFQARDWRTQYVTDLIRLNNARHFWPMCLKTFYILTVVDGYFLAWSVYFGKFYDFYGVIQKKMKMLLWGKNHTLESSRW